MSIQAPVMSALRCQEDMSGRLRIGVEGERDITIEELERIEVTLTNHGGGEFTGWGKDRSKELPVGSFLDEKKGIFYWMPGPGFLGEHVLHFAVTEGNLMSHPIEIVVHIEPKGFKSRRESTKSEDIRLKKVKKIR